MVGKIISFLGGLVVAGVAAFFIVQANDSHTASDNLDINNLNGSYKVQNEKLKSNVTLKNGNFKQETSSKQKYTGKVNLYKSHSKIYYILQSSNSQNVFMYEYTKTKKGFDAKRIIHGDKVIETNHYVKITK